MSDRLDHLLEQAPLIDEGLEALIAATRPPVTLKAAVDALVALGAERPHLSLTRREWALIALRARRGRQGEALLRQAWGARTPTAGEALLERARALEEARRDDRRRRRQQRVEAHEVEPEGARRGPAPLKPKRLAAPIAWAAWPEPGPGGFDEPLRALEALSPLASPPHRLGERGRMRWACEALVAMMSAPATPEARSQIEALAARLAPRFGVWHLHQLYAARDAIDPSWRGVISGMSREIGGPARPAWRLAEASRLARWMRRRGGLEGRLGDAPVNGAGTHGSMDYPPFNITVRPAVTAIAPTLAVALAQLDEEMLALNHRLHFESHSIPEVIHHLLTDAATRISWPGEGDIERARRHISAYAHLRQEGREGRIHRKHIRRASSAARGLTRGALRWEQVKPALGIEQAWAALAHCLLDEARRAPAREAPAWVHAARTLAFFVDGLSRGREGRARVDELLRRFYRAPERLLELLGIPRGEGLPRLPGGAKTPREHRFDRLYKRITGGARGGRLGGEEARRFEVRPLSKLEALERHALGADSSHSVRHRCLSPHHVYYGFWEGGRRLRGYATVLEAWAHAPDGRALPVLCLETINVPSAALDAAQLELLRAFQAVARGRGLGGLVLLDNLGTWNYLNGWALPRTRPAQEGVEVALTPADPAVWAAHEALYPDEAGYGCAFSASAEGQRFKLLADLDPCLDHLQPEGATEAARLSALGGRLLLTLGAPSAPLGFTSGLPYVGVLTADPSCLR